MPLTSSTDLSPQKRRQSNAAPTAEDPVDHSPSLSTSLKSYASGESHLHRPSLKPNLRWATPEWREGGPTVIVVQFLVTKSEDVMVEMIGPDQLWFRCRGQHREDVNLPRGSVVARHAEQKALRFRHHHHILGRVMDKGDQSNRHSIGHQQQQQHHKPKDGTQRSITEFLGDAVSELDEDGQPADERSYSELDDFDVIISLWGSATLLDREPTRCIDRVEIRLLPLGPEWERLTRHSPGELPFLVSYAWELEEGAGADISATTAARANQQEEEDRLSDLNSSHRRRSSAADRSVTTPNANETAAHHIDQHHDHPEEDHHHHKDEGIRWLWSKESLLSMTVTVIAFGVEAFFEYHQHHQTGHHHH